MAKLLDVSMHTVQAIELGKLEMSPKLLSRFDIVSQAGSVIQIIEARVQKYRAQMYKDSGLPPP